MGAELFEHTKSAFVKTFGGDPSLAARAPGRVELLGNHTDYNGGLVLAAAIDRQTIVVGAPLSGPEHVARICSVNLDRCETFELERLTQGDPGSWVRYVAGALWSLQTAEGSLPGGFDAMINGDVPLGAGLSSSASVQVAVLLFALAASAGEGGFELDDRRRMELAKLTQRAENEFVGVNSGLLDPFTSLFGRRDHAVLLDCRTLSYERLPLGDPPPAIVVCDSGTSRRLADGMYNRRRAECEAVVAHFRKERGAAAVRDLRDVSLADLELHWDRLDPIGRRRARHVLTENSRVEEGAQLLKRGDVRGFGALLAASHRSSALDFENSSPELDALVAIARDAPGFLGGKLSGAGWAGCTVNLVEAESADAFAKLIAREYEKVAATRPAVHICRAAEGASAGPIELQ